MGWDGFAPPPSSAEIDREPGIKRIERFPNHTLSSLPFVRWICLTNFPALHWPFALWVYQQRAVTGVWTWRRITAGNPTGRSKGCDISQLQLVAFMWSCQRGDSICLLKEDKQWILNSSSLQNWFHTIKKASIYRLVRLPLHDRFHTIKMLTQMNQSSLHLKDKCDSSF